MTADHWVTGEWQGPLLRRWEWLIHHDEQGYPTSADIVRVQYIPRHRQPQLLLGCAEWLWNMTTRREETDHADLELLDEHLG